MENYLNILEDSLNKKIKLLDKIYECNEKQKASLGDVSGPLSQFDDYLEEKEELIAELSRLDEGFETVYEKVAQILKDNKEAYADQIARMQQAIRTITEKTVLVQSQEARLKEMISHYFAANRKKNQEHKRSANIAMNYYKAQNNAGGDFSRFIDDKQ